MEITHCLRSSDKHGRDRLGIQWPRLGPISDPDWSDDPRYKGGLHGFLMGEGDGTQLNWDPDAVWQVFACDADQVVDLGDQVKAPRAWVVFSGSRDDAIYMIRDLYPDVDVIGECIETYTFGVSVVGDGGLAQTGDGGRAMAGRFGTATAWDGGMAMTDWGGCAKAGDCGTAIVEDNGTAMAGDCGRAYAGDGGTAVAGDHGIAVAGVSGTARVGADGQASVGALGRASAGPDGIISIEYLPGSTIKVGRLGRPVAGHSGAIGIEHDTRRPRLLVGYIGEGGLLPDTLYQVSSAGDFVVADLPE